MKVWEKCNEVKGTTATIEEIASWAYENRICPLSFDVGLEIDVPCDDDGYPTQDGNGFVVTALKHCKGQPCGHDCLMAYLNREFIEVTK